MKCNRYLIPLLCAGLAAQAFAAGGEDEIIARMGSIELTRKDMTPVTGTLPPQLTAEQIRAVDQALRAELIRRALLKEATQAAWDKKPEVQQQIDAAREQVIVATFINHQARPAPSYPTDAEIQAAYEANKPLLVRPNEVHLAQIYVAEQAKADEAARRAREKGADFAQLSAKYSQHAESARNGGDMGWLPLETLTSEVRAAAEKLAPGEISKPVKGAQGWHVLKLIARKGGEPIPLAEVRERLVQSLRLKRAQENEQRYLEQLVSRTPITVNEIALARGGTPGK